MCQWTKWTETWRFRRKRRSWHVRSELHATSPTEYRSHSWKIRYPHAIHLQQLWQVRAYVFNFTVPYCHCSGNETQEISRVEQYPIFLVFLNLIKAYDTVDRGRVIRTLEGYGAGPLMHELLVTLWVYQEFVTRQNCYHSPNFKVTRGTTQGGLISLTLFNVVVNNVVRKWLAMTAKDQTVA